jgi:hypothetical protein
MFRRSAIGSHSWFFIVLSCGPAFGYAAKAQDESAGFSAESLAALLQRVRTNVLVNEELVQQYACDDLVHSVQWNTKWKKLNEHLEKFEVVFVDGLPYRHMVQENGKPLGAQKLISEQKRQDTLSELGKDFDFVFYLRDGSPSDSVFSALPICCLTALFDNRFLRHEQIEGRDNLVIESLPKSNPSDVSPVEKTSLDWKETTWIDSKDLMPTRLEVELLNDKSFLLKGSTDRRDFFPLQIPPDRNNHPVQTVWLLRYDEGHSNLKFLWSRQTELFEDTSSNYRRFQVDARVLPDSIRDVPQQGVSAKH